MAQDTQEPTSSPAETPAPPEGEFGKIGPGAAAKVHGDDVQANLSAIGTVASGTLSATGSVIGIAAVDGDATVTASAVPAVMARGELTMQQSYASAIIVGGSGEMKIHQAAAPLIVGKTIDVSQSGACSLVANEMSVKQSWVGVVVGTHVEVSEDSRVLISTRAALIIAAAILGGFGLVALVGVMGMRRMRRRWRQSMHLPQLRDLQQFASQHGVPDISAIQERIAQMKRRVS
jgi:hypothetical protein